MKEWVFFPLFSYKNAGKGRCYLESVWVWVEALHGITRYSEKGSGG